MILIQLITNNNNNHTQTLVHYELKIYLKKFATIRKKFAECTFR